MLSQDANVAFMAALSARAHAAGLAAGQKNASELVARAGALGTDFAVAEECNRYDECDVYKSAYGARVFVIEYRKQDFDKGCANQPDLSIVLRDLNVSKPGASSYVFDGC
ncbi:MAG TPA: endo alpha-1,4 polygalactosaminidase [Polyangia bacterium]|nr:endo alpha-1,4 polygalactosaminidase [Polyangia bacterium]